MQRGNLNDLLAFVAVGRERSFTRAAAKLGISQSALSHTIRDLEARLGVRLLTRTTRSVSPTEAGERLLQTVGPRLEEIEAELEAVSELREKPAGTIRITAIDHVVDTILMPKLAKFLRDYPDIKVEITIDYGLTDIVAQRYDAGVRSGEQLAKGMIAVRIGPDTRMAVVGAPSYFRKRPEPKTPQELIGHTCINLRLPTHGGLYAWEFEKAGQELRVRVEGQLVFNATAQMLNAALAGFGLAYAPEDLARPHLAKGRLKRVLEDWCPPFSGSRRSPYLGTTPPDRHRLNRTPARGSRRGKFTRIERKRPMARHASPRSREADARRRIGRQGRRAYANLPRRHILCQSGISGAPGQKCGGTMRRRLFLLSAVVMTAVLPRSVAAQSPGRIARVGWLTAQRPASLAPYLDALRAGLADLGYQEGRNLAIEYRYGDDDIERVPGLAAELLRAPVDLLLVQGAAVPVVGRLDLPIPVVYVFSGDPVSAGLADSLARPRGNMTGLTFMAAEVNGKRLELLRDILPDLRRVAVIANPEHPGEQLERGYFEEMGTRLGVAVAYFPTRTIDELASAFAAISADRPQAISVFSDGFAIQNRERIINFAMSQGLPVISGWSVFARSGALCTFGPRLSESYRRLAYYVDRIIKGAKPADLPIEQPTTFELVINMRTAKALGLTMPPSLLAQADELIE